MEHKNIYQLVLAGVLCVRYRFGCTYGYAEGDYRTDVLYLGCGYRFAFGYGLQYFRAAVEICQSGSTFY